MTNIISGSWQKIVLVNYIVSPGVLLDLLPSGTQVSFFEGKCFITLAGFVFSDITVLGVRLPFHRHVPEVNLRFYVESSFEKDRKRGVVFIKELASKRLLATMANRFYMQNYSVKNIGYTYEEQRSTASIKYTWGRLRRNTMKAKLGRVPAAPVKPHSEADFILHNFFGYSNKPDKPTVRYEVSHPLWTLSNVLDWKVKVNFEKSFGKRFAFLSDQEPHSVFVTEGSTIAIHRPTKFATHQIERAA
jgi:uncharacterized protein YqjF (DUF2071 family)